MKIKAVKCSGCQDVIFSRATHDHHACSCGKTFIDGGFEYVRSGWADDISQPIHVDIDVDATKERLYQDWNSGADKFGIIKEKK